MKAVGSCQDDDSQRTQPGVAADGTQHFKSLCSRKFQIEQNEIGQRKFISGGIPSASLEVVDRLLCAAHDEERVMNRSPLKRCSHEERIVFAVLHQKDNR